MRSIKNIEIVVLDKLHILSKRIQNRLGMITESEVSITEIDEFSIKVWCNVRYKFMCYFDDVERDKKLELLSLTLYRNLDHIRNYGLIRFTLKITNK